MTVKYRTKAEVDAAKLDEELVILNPDHYTVTKINEVGSYCWDLLQEIQTIDSLTKALLEKFSAEVTIQQVQKDIEQFLEKLVEYDLIQHVDG